MISRRSWIAAAAGGMLAADRKNRAPISRDLPAVKFPEAVPVKLSNGLTLLALEDRRLPLVWTRFNVEGAGQVYETQPGLAAITCDLLREGAGTRSGKQIAEDSSRLGVMSGFTLTQGSEVAIIDGQGLASRFSEWLPLMADMLARPAFQPDEYNMQKQRWRQGQVFRRNQPASQADDAFYAMIYQGHPAGKTPGPESADSLNLDAIQKWHRERFAPGNVVCSMMGAVKASSLPGMIEKHLGDWKQLAPSLALPPVPPPAAARRIRIVDRPGAPQTELMVGGMLFERREPDYFPFAVLNSLLGVGNASRLYQRLRAEKGYAYLVGSMFSAVRYPGFWRMRAAVRSDVTGESVGIMLDELSRLCNDPAPAAELDDVKSGLVGRFALTLEDPTQVIAYSYIRYRYGFSGDYWNRYPAQLAAVAASEIQNVARKYADPAKAQIVAVGDASKIRAALAKFGPIEVG